MTAISKDLLLAIPAMVPPKRGWKAGEWLGYCGAPRD